MTPDIEQALADYRAASERLQHATDRLDAVGVDMDAARREYELAELDYHSAQGQLLVLAETGVDA